MRRLKSVKQKSLGIAYVDFKSPTQSEQAKNDLDGKQLHGRPLKVKSFIPYAPNSKISTGELTKPQISSSVGANDKENHPTTAEFDGENTLAEGTVSKIPVSDVTVFIRRLSGKITDGDLREYFHEYVPTEVYIFKSRTARRQKSFFRHGEVSALVTLTAENGLVKALEELREVELKGKKIRFQAAYVSKVQEVRRAAETRQKLLHGAEAEIKQGGRKQEVTAEEQASEGGVQQSEK